MSVASHLYGRTVLMMNYNEDNLLPISGLQHLAYCPRQFALIHIEQQWEENRYTAEGQLLHQRVDQEHRESRGSIHIAHALRLRSLQHGLTGIADVVEFHRTAEGKGGINLQGKQGQWIPYPVEYKRGRPKKDNIDAVQLCAQALCLEEMLSIEVPVGALFYGKTRRRKETTFTGSLREETQELTQAMHQLVIEQATVVAEKSKKCEQCSLLSICMPTDGESVKVKSYIEQLFSDVLETE
mgnify:CR=1 FL=1